MSEPSEFIYLRHDPSTGKGSLVRAGVDGVTTFAELVPGQPCTCPCWGVLLPDGTLYGPGMPQQVREAVLALPESMDWQMGVLGRLREGTVLVERPLSDLLLTD